MSGGYAALSERFERMHFREGGGGTRLEYITGEQAVSRLNDVLGYDGWSFSILNHGIHDEADEVWVLGELTVIGDGRADVKRQQFGSQKIKRYRAKDGRGAPLEVGFDLKGAATDCLKKCASLVGVGLFLYDKDEHTSDKDPASHRPASREAVPARQAQATHLGTAPTGTGAASRAVSTSAPAGGAMPHTEHAPKGEPAPITAFFERTHGEWHASRAQTRLLLDPNGLDDDLSDVEAVKAALQRFEQPITPKGLDRLFTLCAPAREAVTA